MFTNSRTALLIGFCFFGTLACAFSDTAEDPDNAVQQAKTFGLRGDWPAAEAVLKRAISNSKVPDGLDAIHLWNELGHVMESQSNLDEAQKDYERALQLNETLRPASLADMAISFNNLGTVSEIRRNYSSAENYFRRALDSYQRDGVEDAGVIGAVYANLAMSIQRQERFHEPSALYEQALTLLMKAHGENSPEYAKALTDFGLFQQETGNYVRGLELQKRANEIVASQPSFTAADKAHVLNNLGMALLEVGNTSEAIVALRHSLEIQKAARAQSADTILILNNIATVEQRTGQLNEARRDQSEALTIAATLLPSNDPIWGILWSNLGKIAVREGKTSEAQQFYGKALSLWIETEGKSSNYAATLTSIASIEARKCRHRLAGSMYAEALQIDERVLGENHPRVASDLANVGVELCFQHKFAEAVPLFQSSVQIGENTFGPTNINVARSLRMLGLAYGRCKELPEADGAYRKAIAIAKSQIDTPELMTWLSEYAQILLGEQKYGEAEQAYVQMNGIRVRNALIANRSQTLAKP